MNSIKNISYGEHPAQRLDIHLPDCESFPVFIYFHGGGLKAGDKAGEHETNAYRCLTSRGIAAVGVNYRLYPGAEYPQFIDDAARAAAFVVNNIGSCGNAGGIYLGGSSAGAYLSMMLCFDSSRLARYGLSPLRFSGFLHDAGQPTCHFNVLKERGFDPRRVVADDTAPIFHVGADERYAPMLIMVSDNDMENRYEQNILLLSTLRHFGHKEPKVRLKIMHGTHCEYLSKTDQNGESLFGGIVCDFIKDTERLQKNKENG